MSQNQRLLLYAFIMLAAVRLRRRWANTCSDVFDSYSAGSETKPQINQDVIRLMKVLYGIDMEQEQYSKTFDKNPGTGYCHFDGL